MSLSILRRIAQGVIAASLLVFVTTAVQAQTARLEGRVVDSETGQPVPDVNVIARGPGGQHGAATDSEGRYELPSLTEGRYRVIARAVGYVRGEEDVRLEGSEARVLDFRLEVETFGLDAVVVSATRGEERLRAVPSSVSVLPAETLERQRAVTSDLGAILAQSVPGLAPSSGTLSNYGQSLRGREMAVLIDGVPQNTPLRNASRWLRTIAPAAIGRVEVVRGASAIYGNEATGGVVNIMTKRPSVEALSFRTEVGTRFAPVEVGDSFNGRLLQQATGRMGAFDFLVNGAYESRGYAYDADGDLIPQDPQGQGGLAGSSEYNVLAKVGWQLDARQRLELTANYYDFKQDLKYETLAGVPGQEKAGAAASDSIPGLDPGTQNLVASLGYEHTDVAGSQVRARLYAQDYMTRFTFYPLHPGGGGQGYVESAKVGARVDVETPFAGRPGAGLRWGIDALSDRTAQPFVDGRDYVPPMEQRSLAPFAEARVLLGDRLLLRGGLRYEYLRLSVDDYSTVYVPGPVEGGVLTYSALLPNAGAVLYLTEQAEVFASFGQGFSAADVGRVLRSTPVESVAQLDPEAQKVTSYEVGVRGGVDRAYATVSGFYNTSELGATFSDLPELRIIRSPEQVYGVEATLDVEPTADLSIGGTAAYVEGKRDADDDGEHETYLPGDRIPPLKLTGYVRYSPVPEWTSQVQVLHSGERDRFDGSTVFAEGAVESYTTVALYSSLAVGPGVLRLGVENVFDTFYYPTVAQWYNAGAGYSAAPGRQVSLTFAVDW